mmetsp:Transcript_42597/g.102690  ORF Transcript_42597/g.102690 Transcript_42597/m.102690 type:complete len:143 (+) Transcript_42597:320-748(+)
MNSRQTNKQKRLDTDGSIFSFFLSTVRYGTVCLYGRSMIQYSHHHHHHTGTNTNTVVHVVVVVVISIWRSNSNFVSYRWYGMVLYCMVLYGMVWYGIVLVGILLYGIVSSHYSLSLSCHTTHILYILWLPACVVPSLSLTTT